jgi:asparagine synthase (glutamine-hydrolysing)
MCGIYGMVSLTGSALAHPELMSGMGRALRHRGPDASGRLVRARGALGAERLRIMDPDPRADQPLHDRASDRWLVCNGELYNAPALRAQYRAYPFRTKTDVEPLLPMLQADGPEALSSVAGMFALAAWHEGTNALTLARDRAGEKPLFYIVVDNEVWFASEIQALLLHPRFAREIDPVARQDYLAFGHVREPRTLFRGLHKVGAGTFLTFGADCRPPEARPFARVVAPEVNGPDRAGALSDLLRCAVRRQVKADVPVGSFLSGGLDSTLVTSLASTELKPSPIDCFTVAFPSRSYDEREHARAVTQHFGGRYHEVLADDTALRAALAEVVSRFAEPVADPAVLPTIMLARHARNHVGVVLSGEGADELFGGYPTYIGHWLAEAISRVPAGLRRSSSRLLRSAAGAPRSVSPAFLAYRLLDHAEDDWAARHLTWFGTGLFPFLDRRVKAGLVESIHEHSSNGTAAGNPPGAQAMALDFATYLREGLLVKLDRATMAHSLEARAPFLDPDLSAFARDLPLEAKVRRFTTKRLLREVARDVVPRWVIRRRKHGLRVPIAEWINGTLRPEVDRLLDPRRISFTGLACDLPVRRLLSEHRSGHANHARALWAVIMLQYWFEHWVEESG